jgi:hypothetical protein
MMENRSIFALDGITGMLIATVLLLSILGVLTILAIGAQQGNAENFYVIENPKEIQMINPDSVNHRVNVK